MGHSQTSQSTPFRTIPQKIISLKGISTGLKAHSQADQVEVAKLSVALNRILSGAGSGFKELRAGTGTTMDEETSYPSSVAVPGTSKTTIWIPQDSERRPYIDANIYSGKNMSEAVRRYNTYVDKLKTSLSDWKGNERKINDERGESRVFILQRNETDATIFLRYYSTEKSGQYRVYLTFEAPEQVKPEPPRPQPTVQPVVKDLSAASKEVVKKLIAKDYRGITEEFNDSMKATVSAEKIEEGWLSLTKNLGQIKSQDEPELRQIQGWDVVVIKCEMVNGFMEVEIGYDTQGKIGAFWIRPR